MKTKNILGLEDLSCQDLANATGGGLGGLIKGKDTIYTTCTCKPDGSSDSNDRDVKTDRDIKDALPGK